MERFIFIFMEYFLICKINNNNSNNMEKWTVCAMCLKSCLLFPIPFILLVIIVKEYLSGFINLCLDAPSNP